MASSKKDFEQVAGAVKAATQKAMQRSSADVEYRDGMRFMRAMIISELALMFAETNSKFDSDKFYHACMITNE